MNVELKPRLIRCIGGPLAGSMQTFKDLDRSGKDIRAGYWLYKSEFAKHTFLWLWKDLLVQKVARNLRSN